jgi:hypothetical protein
MTTRFVWKFCVRAAFCCIAAVGAVHLSTSRAAAGISTWPVTAMCVEESAVIHANADYFETFNPTDYGSVDCGVSLYQHSAASTTDDMFIYYYDADTGTASNDSVHCYAYSQSWDTSVVNYEGVKYSCSTAGGCASETDGSFEGYLAFSNLDRPAYGHTAFTCIIPGASALFSVYYVD